MGRINEAFASVPREIFLPPQERPHAGWDIPLPIGFGQTNSQPTTVRMMLEWLDARPGQQVLDVGSGSGWTSALLAKLVGEKGKVIAVERVPELVKFGRENCEQLGLSNVEFHQAGEALGWPNESQYDRILVSAAGRDVPQELVGQLAPGGRMVIPVLDSVYVLQKDSKGEISRTDYPGFAFVPLI